MSEAGRCERRGLKALPNVFNADEGQRNAGYAIRTTRSRLHRLEFKGLLEAEIVRSRQLDNMTWLDPGDLSDALPPIG